MDKSSSSQRFFKKGVLNFVIFKAKHLCFPVNIFKNSFFYRAPLVAAPEWPQIILLDAMMLKSELTHVDLTISKKDFSITGIGETWFLWEWCQVVKAVTRRWSVKKEFLKNSQNSQANTSHCWSLFLVKLKVLKRGPSIGVFLWILPYFQNIYFVKHLRSAASGVVTDD